MFASIHLTDIGVRRALTVLRGAPRRGSTPGLGYATAVAAAPLGASGIAGSGFAAPQPGSVGLIALWDDEAALDGFLAGHRLAAVLAGGWHVRLTAVNAHDYHGARGSSSAGSWPGVTGDVTDPAPLDGPAVVLTLARTKPSQFLRFTRASFQAARPLKSSPGLIWASALARPPIVATCSLWSSSAALEAYAYGSKGHRQAMAADRERPFHQSGVFFRFHPTKSTGQLDGRNPLSADWMNAGVRSADVSS